MNSESYINYKVSENFSGLLKYVNLQSDGWIWIQKNWINILMVAIFYAAMSSRIKLTQRNRGKEIDNKFRCNQNGGKCMV